MVEALENEVREAQLRNDAVALDGLIDDELQFVFLDGSVATKADDLAAHRSRVVVFDSIEFEDRRIVEQDDRAVVTCRAKIQGKMQGRSFEGTYRYLRVWIRRPDGWRVVAGCVTEVRD